MKSRWPLVLPLVATGLALMVAPAPALAAKPASQPVPRVHVIPPPAGEKTVGSASANCPIGVSDASLAWDYVLYPPADEYLTLLDPATCPCGPGSDPAITAVHWKLYWATACNPIPVTIRLLGALQDPSDPTCWMPDPTNVLAGPFNESLDGGAGGFVDHTFSEAFPALAQKVFLGFTVGPAGDCPVTTPSDPVAAGYLTSPLLATDSPAPTPPLSCVSYNIYPDDGSHPNGYDITVSPGVAANSSIWVDTDCVTPTVKRTWGQLKVLYR